MILHFTLTEIPPTLNHIRVPVGGRLVNSKEYKAWRAGAEWELKTQPGRIPGGYWRADILIPGTCKADLDNVSAKPIFDALVAMEKVPDDAYLVDYRVRFHAGDKVLIAVKQEELTEWASIKRASKSLTTKLAKSTR